MFGPSSSIGMVDKFFMNFAHLATRHFEGATLRPAGLIGSSLLMQSVESPGPTSTVGFLRRWRSRPAREMACTNRSPCHSVGEQSSARAKAEEMLQCVISNPKFLLTGTESLAESAACPFCVVSPYPCTLSKALMLQWVSAHYMDTEKRHEIDNWLIRQTFVIVANKNSGLTRTPNGLKGLTANRRRCCNFVWLDRPPGCWRARLSSAPPASRAMSPRGRRSKDESSRGHQTICSKSHAKPVWGRNASASSARLHVVEPIIGPPAAIDFSGVFRVVTGNESGSAARIMEHALVMRIMGRTVGSCLGSPRTPRQRTAHGGAGLRRTRLAR
jgi:hypothetical protein